METQIAEPVLVSRSEAARMLGVSRNTVIRLAQRGLLHEIRLAPGMHPRIAVAEVLALAGEQKDATSSARAGQYALVADPDLARALDADNEEATA